MKAQSTYKGIQAPSCSTFHYPNTCASQAHVNQSEGNMCSVSHCLVGNHLLHLEPGSYHHWPDHLGLDSVHWDQLKRRTEKCFTSNLQPGDHIELQLTLQWHHFKLDIPLKKTRWVHVTLCSTLIIQHSSPRLPNRRSMALPQYTALLCWTSVAYMEKQ